MLLASGQQEAQALEIERAEARAAAELAAEEQAERASRDAELAGESAVRRAFAASAAAEEAGADTADAQQAGQIAAVPAGAVLGDGTANCPPAYPIKGNRQSRIYHRPGQVSYSSTIAEYCFDSAEAAELAGFRVSRARGQRSRQ
jgi:large subunit ribosomal protein L17